MLQWIISWRVLGALAVDNYQAYKRHAWSKMSAQKSDGRKTELHARSKLEKMLNKGAVGKKGAKKTHLSGRRSGRRD